MAEYLAVEYNGLYNRYKQNTDYLEAPIVATTTTQPLTKEQATAKAEADRLAQEALTAQSEASLTLTLATLAQTAVDEAVLALSLASAEDIATAQLALDKAVRLAQEAQTKAEEAQVKAEASQALAQQAEIATIDDTIKLAIDEATRIAQLAQTTADNALSTIGELNFNTLGSDIYKYTNPLKLITTFEQPYPVFNFALPRNILTQYTDGNFTNIKTNSNAVYNEQNNRWDIQGNNGVTFNESVINGAGPFSI